MDVSIRTDRNLLFEAEFKSEKTFNYRIKIVGDLPAGFISDFKDKLKKFDPVSISEVKKTPIVSKPTDFPDFNNESVTDRNLLFEAEFKREN
jgi:hypothetical protein